MYYSKAPIPAASAEVFHGGIDHPDLWLWDSWTLNEPGAPWRLYCLALSKVGFDGQPITPPERNDFTFHVRHFISDDFGRSWSDLGAILTPGQVADGADARNIWSGSVVRLDEHSVAFGFTGVQDCGADRRYLQNICVATGPSPDRVEHMPDTAISCPVRDYDAILAMGYYLGPRETLGHNDGEDGGPIMAWRDPFLFHDEHGALHAIWSAKLGPITPAIAHARLERDGDRVSLAELFPPISLPDGALMTQSEVPKIYRDTTSGDYLLLVSACDRQYEGQPDSELTHIHRLYCSAALQGPWRPYSAEGSALPGLDGLFGASLVGHDVPAGRFAVLGPFTENAGPDKQLRFAEIVDVPCNMNSSREEVSPV